jgi:pimeloyl-ACP methyl ester carboxylesterase
LALTGSRTATLIPGARLSVYENAPHALYLTHRERLNRDLIAFIEEQPSGMLDTASGAPVSV